MEVNRNYKINKCNNKIIKIIVKKSFINKIINFLNQIIIYYKVNKILIF